MAVDTRQMAPRYHRRTSPRKYDDDRSSRRLRAPCAGRPTLPPDDHDTPGDPTDEATTDMGVLRGFERRLEGAVEGMFARAFRSGLQPIELAQATQRYCTDHKQVTSRGVVAPNQYRFILNPEDLDRMESHGSSLHRELGEVVRETCRDHDWALYGAPSFTFESDDDIMLGRFEITGRIGTDTTGAQRAAAANQPPGQQHPQPQPTQPRPAQPPAAAAPTPVPAPAPTPSTPAPDTASPDSRRATTGPQPTPAPGALFGDASADPAGVTAQRPTGAPPGVLPGAPMPGTTPSGPASGPHPTEALASAPASAAPPAGPTPPSRRAPMLHIEVLDTGADLHVRQGRYTIGRSQESDLSIDSTTVSRKHAVIVERGDTWWVFDLGSTNGTRVNGQRASELPIRPGDRVRVGTVELLVREA